MLLWGRWWRVDWSNSGLSSDPWLESVAWPWLLLGLLLLAGIAFRLGWPTAKFRAVDGPWAWSLYAGVQLSSLLWMLPWLQLSPLYQQWAYCLGLLCLLLWLGPRIDWRLSPGWWRWGLAAWAWAFLGALLYGWLCQPGPSSNPAVELLRQSQGPEKWAWLFLLVVATPLQEEAWFRGALSGPQPLRLLVAAVTFAAVHCDPWALPQLLWLGLVLSWARWGGGLAASVLAHGLWNLLVALYLQLEN